MNAITTTARRVAYFRDTQLTSTKHYFATDAELLLEAEAEARHADIVYEGALRADTEPRVHIDEMRAELRIVALADDETDPGA